MTRGGELLGDRDREQRLPAPRRPRHRRAASMEHEREHPRLVRRELDDLLVLLVEPQPQRRADLHPEPECRRDGVHPLGAEPPSRSRPGPHDLRDAFGEPVQVVAIDHDLDGRAGMRGPLVPSIGERDAEPVARAPPLPSRLTLQDAYERVHRPLRLVERVLVQIVRAGVTRLGPPLRTRVERHASALHLEREQPQLGMRDHEVRLTLIGSGATADDPVDRVVHDVGVVQLLEEALVQPTLRGAFGREHGERDHPRHGRDAIGAFLDTGRSAWDPPHPHR